MLDADVRRVLDGTSIAHLATILPDNRSSRATDRRRRLSAERPSIAWLAGHCQQMSAEPEDRRFRLDESGRAEDDVPVCRIGPAVLQVWEPSGEAFDADEVDERQVHRADLLRQLLGSVEERSREPVRPVLRVRVPAVGQVTSNDLAELPVEEKFTPRGRRTATRTG